MARPLSALACPVYQGQQGHPILLSAGLIPLILADYGEGGLRGALDRCGQAMTQIAVEDPGTLHDADTPQDFSALLDYHNSQLLRPVVHVALHKEKLFFDNKMAMLLMLIDETNSVRAAGQRMQLSYSSCWNRIHTLESQLSYTLIERSQGGAGGGTSVLTPQGKQLLDAFARYEQRLREIAEELYPDYFGGLLP